MKSKHNHKLRIIRMQFKSKSKFQNWIIKMFYTYENECRSMYTVTCYRIVHQGIKT